MLITPDDINQEAELLKLQGKSPHKGIIRKKLERLANSDLELDLDTWGEALDALMGIEPSASEVLLDWSLEQDSEVQQAIDAFLSDPEKLFNSTFEFLRNRDLLVEIRPAEPKEKKTISYAQLMRQNLPCTKDELITFMSRFPIKRPASTVRQFIRRNHLKEDANGILR